MSRTRIRALRFTLWSTAILLFAGLLSITAGHKLLVFGYDHAFSRIAVGDSLYRVTDVMGLAHETRKARFENGKTELVYCVYPLFMGENMLVRTQWRIVVDSSGRVMSKQRNDNGC